MNLSCGECDIISLHFICCSINGYVCLVCCVFDSVCELFVEIIRNLLDTPYMVCVCCACDPNVHQSITSIGVVHVFICWKISPHLRV